jgi:GT2 family glycosyltransferase
MSLELRRSSAPRVSIIIPATAKPDLLQACLASLARNLPNDIPYETIVVLNEAKPEPAAQLAKSAIGIEVVSSPVNLGLAGAGNRARALAQGEYLILLHDDSEIEPGWLEALVETADSHPEAGAVFSRVHSFDGSLQTAGGIIWRNATVSHPWLGGSPPDFIDRVRPIDTPGTSSLLVRASAWDAVGGLDERFYPVYFVDLNLAMSLRQIDKVVLCDPRSRTRHHQGGKRSIRFRGFVFYINRQLFIEKWGSALESLEPWEENSQDAIDRALIRTEAFADQCRRRVANATKTSTAERPAFDPAEQEMRCWEKSRDIQTLYAAYLSKMLDQAEAELARHRSPPGQGVWQAGDFLGRK